MPLRVAINGLGRIGRSLFRVLLDRPGLELVALNDVADPATTVHLIRFDSVRGPLPVPLPLTPQGLQLGTQHVPVLCEPEPARLPWADLGVQVVFECSGRHTRRAQAAGHLDAGAGHVLVSAPVEDADVTVVRGVNEEQLAPRRQRVISNASCTTHCIAPLLRIVHDRFGVAEGLLTTVHAYTNDQQLLDHPHDDLRRARAAGLSLVPTTTGAARAVGRVLPALAGRLDGVSVRVPTPDVSLADLTLLLERPAPAQRVNEALRQAAEGPLAGVLGYTELPLVSADYIGCTRSAVVDGLQTREVGGRLVKLQAWYDNEWAYTHRLADLAERLAESGELEVSA